MPDEVWVQQLHNQTVQEALEILDSVHRQLDLPALGGIFVSTRPRSADDHEDFDNSQEDFRWGVLARLKDEGVLVSFQREQGGESGTHWMIRVVPERTRIVPCIEALRVRQAGPTTTPSTRALEAPERVTLGWLTKHVPWKLWVAAVGILLAVFSAGVWAGENDFVRGVIRLWRGAGDEQAMPTNAEVRSPSVTGGHRQAADSTRR